MISLCCFNFHFLWVRLKLFFSLLNSYVLFPFLWIICSIFHPKPFGIVSLFLTNFQHFWFFLFFVLTNTISCLSQIEVAYIFPSLGFAYSFWLCRSFSVFVFIFNNVFSPYECFLFCLLVFCVETKKALPTSGL